MENTNTTTVTATTTAAATIQNNSTVEAIITKIRESQNILVALSSDPSIDELSAAIGLSMYLEGLKKHVTTIYSGATPDVLSFLKPEETFSNSADALQDFVIAINKDKADHLRYKVDGDFVKVYITPFKERISNDDLEFSYGDFNVDLVISLDVSNGVDLDAALREHGRIMHDANIINITNGKPGNFGEMEFRDTSASSISEVVAKIIYAMVADQPVNSGVATALLTGIIAATDRFSNSMTTPESLRLASDLMKSGANNAVVSENIISAGIDNNMIKIDDAEAQTISNSSAVEVKELPADDELKDAEAALSMAGTETVPVEEKEPVVINSTAEKVIAVPDGLADELAATMPEIELGAPTDDVLPIVAAPVMPETPDTGAFKIPEM